MLPLPIDYIYCISHESFSFAALAIFLACQFRISFVAQHSCFNSGRHLHLWQWFILQNSNAFHVRTTLYANDFYYNTLFCLALIRCINRIMKFIYWHCCLWIFYFLFRCVLSPSRFFARSFTDFTSNEFIVELVFWRRIFIIYIKLHQDLDALWLSTSAISMQPNSLRIKWNPWKRTSCVRVK